MTPRARIWLYWALFAAMVGLYLTMLLWSLPRISQDAGSMAFDLRSSGYSFDAAQSFLTSLSDQGRDFYLNVQQVLDSIYPAVLGAVLAWSLLWAGRGLPRWILRLSVAFALVSIAADYMENAAVRSMLLDGPEAITAQQVATASMRTLLKFSTVSIAGVILITLLIRRAFLWQKGRSL